MDVFMTIAAEVLPVTTVRRVIQVIAIFVMNGQELPLGRSEFPAASGTD
jgi:hypothetical protein